MRAVGLDIVYTAIMNDEEQSVLSILCGRNVPLTARLEACEFVVEEIKKGIVKQEELDAKEKETEEKETAVEDITPVIEKPAIPEPVEDHV